MMIHTTKPMVSIIMPAYNAESFIHKAILSVQKQTYDNWELIVIDDCSGDGTAEAVKGLAAADPRIRLYKNGENSGVAKTRNRGLKLSQGEYIAFLDSDDVWHADKLEKQLAVFRENRSSMVYTSYAIVDGEGKKLCDDFTVPQTTSFAELLKENVIGCSTVMISAGALGESTFAEDFFHEDYALWLQLLRSGCTASGIEEVLVDYYFHPDSKAGNKRKAAVKRWKIYRQYLQFSPAKSVWYFMQYAFAGIRKYRRI